MSKYFTETEIEDFKSGSIKFPLICYEGTDEKNVVSVWEVTALSGMADNGGLPKKITIRIHSKIGPDVNLTYTLSEMKEVKENFEKW